jgi:branched-chain amino acid transport system permease protein
LFWVISGDVVVAMMFGGMGTLFGPMIGGAAFVALQEILSSYTGQWRFILGLLLVLTVMVAPRGLITVYQSLREQILIRTGLDSDESAEEVGSSAASTGGSHE